MSRTPKLSGKRAPRKRTVRPQRTRTLIVAEGEKTEVEYFDYIGSALRTTTVSVQTVGLGRDPLHVVERAIALVGQERKTAAALGDRYNTYDSAWAVFDVDDHERIVEAIEMANKAEINVAVSNPCFEIWLILHQNEHSSFVSSKGAAEGWTKCSGRTGKQLAKADIEGKFEIAKQRAVRLDEMHKRNSNRFPKNNPSTSVYKLVEMLTRAAAASSPRPIEI